MSAHTNGLVLGDPVPWFRAPNIAGGAVDLHVSAGRWVLLAFFGSLAQAHTRRRLAVLTKEAAECSEDHLMIYVVLAEPPNDPRPLAALSRPNLKFIADYDGAIGAYYGARSRSASTRYAAPNEQKIPRTIGLDPMLRAIANIPCEPANEHDRILEKFLRDLPSVDNSAGVPLAAPVLMVPRVFEFPLCDHLIAIYEKTGREKTGREKTGGAGSGFLGERRGKPAAITDHSPKSRGDMVVVAPDLRRIIRERIMKRLLPAVELFFQFQATHMDRYVVACSDGENLGHSLRRRDHFTVGVEPRRFAVSLNLNGNYEGCDLIFPEFGRQTYRPPTGGAMVFSCGALHEVTPITKGKRYAFLPFLYGQPGVKKGLGNNRLPHTIGVDHRAGQQSLYGGY
jgi:AhpC/TSA family